MDTLTCRGLEDEGYVSRETEKDWIIKGEECVVPESQMKKAVQGGSDEMYHILLGAE